MTVTHIYSSSCYVTPQRFSLPQVEGEAAKEEGKDLLATGFALYFAGTLFEGEKTSCVEHGSRVGPHFRFGSRVRCPRLCC